MTRWRAGLLLVVVAVGGGAVVVAFGSSGSEPEPSTLSVNSSADAVLDDGHCTLREAIVAANDDVASGSSKGECAAGDDDDSITFDIDEPADFIVEGGSGYTISPRSPLPPITAPAIIDGYSQPGARANSAVSPAPLNGVLLIELSGAEAGRNASGLALEGAGVTIRGLVINRFDFDGISIDGRDHAVVGDYIGTDPTGLLDRGNAQRGVASGAGQSEDIHVGGTSPSERNLLSGNDVGAASPDEGHDRWTFQGNYIGVDVTGMSALPNAQFGGSGALSIDNGNDHIVGGVEVGAMNVIAGNRSHALAPFNTDDLLVIGNYIGIAADGMTALDNGGAGIAFGGGSNGAVVAGNHFSGNSLGGVLFHEGSSARSVRDNIFGD